MIVLACPFCDDVRDRLFHEGERVLGIWDAFPVSPGHALLLTRRHVGSWFEAHPEEQAELVRAIQVARACIEERHRPDGYNVGVNVGEAGGQTVPHLHVHVIPRYTGDVPDPRGGVRGVIPGRAPYAELGNGKPLLVRGGEDDPLLHHLTDELDGAERVDIAVAFTMESGVALIEEHLRDVLTRGGRVRFVTGDYLGHTEPNALRRLLDLHEAARLSEDGAPNGDLALRVFESGNTSFHPKAYILVGRAGGGTAFVGSSNLSRSALREGVEWNYRVVPSREAKGFDDVARAFDALFDDPRCRVVDDAWIEAYVLRRPRVPLRIVDAEGGPVEPPPVPHAIQREALAELRRTREAGHAAGLVVLATGLGKTWLSAFDSQPYRRVLFIAHREEILVQAMRTFRRIRPNATLGLYTGKEKAPAADVLFASIQTLSRQQHLRRFEPDAFDYVIVDEFHHAAASTYRRVIGYLEPLFLLGLTATPERTDGGDLLALCGDNLVYRCDVADGIRRGLLSPFSYFGVPDDVDYENIPWRSSRFDEEALTDAVATQFRAENALEQFRGRGGSRALGFCVSQRHADFMATYFAERGVRAVAVHAGATSAPRTTSLERLEAGELDIVFAVDMFNEGVDLPNVDTVLMLRPTESRILWLQQFGRGLRQREGKTLRVIDYIGNHRVFLVKTRALLSLGDADRDVAYALTALEQGTFELPPGCSVTYDLEAKEMLRALVQPTGATESLEAYYRDFVERHGVRPRAMEAFSDGFNPRAVRRDYGSWPGFVRRMGGFTAGEEAAWPYVQPFLEALEATPMTRSYKMVVLLSILGEGTFPGAIGLDRLAERFRDLARRHTAVRTELGEGLDDEVRLQRLLIDNPIAAWTEGKGTGGVAYFTFDGDRFATSARLEIPAAQHAAAQDLVWELAEWRLTEYLRRAGAMPTADRFMAKVSHAGGRPILFLPDRTRTAGIPEGWRDILIGGDQYQAKFVKVALNVVARPGSEENVLPEILRGWFGPAAGQPGRTEQVVFQRRGEEYEMLPASELKTEGPVLWQRYTRDEAAAAFGLEWRGFENQSGFVVRPNAIFLFVTLEKSGMPEAHRYEDKFLSPTEFQWQSQNRTTQASAHGQAILKHRERGVAVHLFVRKLAKVAGRTEPFVYCGEVEFDRWEGERPITVQWRLSEAVPDELLA